MKKLLILSLAAFAMVACVNEEVTELPKGDEIVFDNAFIDNATRVGYATVADLEEFNVWGWIENGNVAIFNGNTVSKTNGQWTYAEEKQYWYPGNHYYFEALADAEVGNVTTEGHALKSVVFNNVDGEDDLLYAAENRAAADLGATNGPVALTFKHLLSKVNFTFTTAFPGVDEVTISEVKMTVPAEGTYTFGEGWAINGTATTTLDFGAAAAGVELLTIPTDATQEYAIEFKVTIVKDGVVIYEPTKTSTVTGVAIEAGHAYNFVAEITPESLNLEDIVFNVNDVNGWENEDLGVYTGETVGVANATELLAAIANPDVTAVVLTDDIDLGSNGITRAEGDASVVINKNFTIDGAGKTLTYGGSNRVIDIKAEDGVVKNAAIKNLTINITSSYCERGINFNNANGSLLVENVTFEGTAPTYALNIPAKADGADVTIKDSYLAGNIALNVWAENMQIDVINSELISVDNVEAENYAAISLCSDGTNVAEGTVINIEGGKVIARDEKGEPSSAFRNSTIYGKINVSETTEVVGNTKEVVAIVDYGTTQSYSFTTLSDAIAKVAKDNKGTVKLIRDIEMTDGVTVANGNNVTIDLNGKTISGTDNATGSYGLITNKGNLTIQGNGKLTLRATNNRNWNAYSSVISNTVGGKLTIEEGVVIEHLGGTDMAYGIDNLTNGKGTYAETVINGGTIKSTYRAVRQFLNGIEAQNILTVNGGVIEGANKSIWMQDPSANANTGKLTVAAEAELKGDVYLFVCAGSTEWPVEVSIAEAALVGESTILTGNVPAGYTVVLENGVYTVVEAAAVTTAEELAAAVANKLETIYVSGEIDLANVVLSGYNGTIVGLDNTAVLNTRNFIPSADECYQLRCEAINFQNITVKVPTEDGDFLKTGFVGFGEINFDNCVFEGQVTLNGQASWTFNNCEFASIETGAYAVFTYGAKKATFNNCEISGVDRAAKVYGTGGVIETEYNNCTFSSTTSNKYAVNIDASYTVTTVTLNGCSQTGMPGLYKVEGTKATVIEK